MWRPFQSRPRILPNRRRRPQAHRAARPALDALEGRVVLSAAFDSVVAVGSDAADILVFDNAVDTAGNTYVIGNLYGTTDFDPAADRPDGSDILIPRGTTDPFVAKYAPDNSLVWVRRVGSEFVDSAGNVSEVGKALDVDGSGNVYITGNFRGQADFGPFTLTSAGGKDAFVAKLGPGGEFLWARNWGGANEELGSGVAVDPSGNVIASGSRWEAGTGYSGCTVQKYSASGAELWSRKVDSYGGTAGHVATDAAGNVYVTGQFHGTVDFDPNPRKTSSVTGATGLYLGAYGRNGFVLKLTGSGAFGWVAPLVAKTSDANIDINDLDVDGSGKVVIVGRYAGQLDFDPSSKVDYRLPGSGGFVEELSATGARLWATPLGGANVRSVAFDASGSVYTAGTFVQTFSPGYGLPSVTSQGYEDAFVAAFTPTGAVDWAITFGGSSSDLATGMALGTDGTIYLAGYSLSSTVDYDPDPLGVHELANPGYRDMFLLKLKRI